jgi:hypothetical protein
MISAVCRLRIAERAARCLGFTCRTGFQEKLDQLTAGVGWHDLAGSVKAAQVPVGRP